MKVLIAGGGTGGHLFPGIAIAEEVIAQGGEVLFVGTERGLEKRVVPAAGYALELLSVSGLKRMSAGKTLLGLARVPLALWQAGRLLRRFRPDAVVGVGGYASGPMGLCAALLGYTVAIQEQNSVPGFTNRILARVARRIFLGFPQAAARFPAHKCVVSGNPVRRAFREAAARAHPVASAADPGGRLLVVGGSQGARAINELVAQAVALLARAGRAPVVLHQTGANDLDATRARYQAGGVGTGPGDRVEVRAFIDDMASAYASVDLVIARAGALTLAELAMMGRPALLIPLPTAADDHQSRNAAAFVEAGAAQVMAQGSATAQALADAVGRLLADPAARARMSAAMRGLARPDAAGEIVAALASSLA